MGQPTTRPDKYYIDGYRDGGELPTERDIDEITFPERYNPQTAPQVEWTEGMTEESYNLAMDRLQTEIEGQHDRRDRDFSITEGNVTGRHTGPPRTS